MKATIHIFGYGEAQIISEKTNFKAPVEKFTKLKAVIDNIKGKRPADKESAEHHAVNIFTGLKADFIAKKSAKETDAKKNNSFSVKYEDLDAKRIEALIAEFQTMAKS